MSQKVKKIFASLLIIGSVSWPWLGVRASFDPNFIISDQDILNYNSMSLSEIEQFLRAKGSFLVNYRAPDPEGNLIPAPQIIYNRAQTNKISPKFILVLLQKEQSLVEDANPTQRQLDWATGYGCPDGGRCNPRWRGFWKQVNSATLQFKYFMNGCNEEGEEYRGNRCEFKPYHTYVFSNPYSTIKRGSSVVTPANLATAALYNYTPHVYNGNYNFYRLWQRYFTRTYPDGTLLQAAGEPGVWLIQNGKKRPFLSKAALLSRFDPNRIIIVSKSELAKYKKGTPIRFPQYSIVRSPRGDIYLLVDDTRRLIQGAEAFRKIGFNPEEVIDASWEEIYAYRPGQPINASSTYVTGALLQNNKTGGVYFVQADTKAPLYDPIFLKTKFKDYSIVPVSPEILAKYRTVDPVKFDDGALLKSANSPAVYVISNGRKHPITSAKVFEGLGYKWENILVVPKKILDLYPLGSRIDDKYLDNFSTQTSL
ncbi:hypothetical protein D6821_01175 [Candidatus Parcubacteria bacterium]|nr:MAG: hypothetical protein D6821_01175 [Candidatus Parcubacteria bacterium]